jgi:hypothetical protein
LQVHLADLFFQEQLVETLQSRSVQRCVLRNLLPSGHGNAAEPHVAWTAVQLEILNNGWIHRIQKQLDLENSMGPGLGKIEFSSLYL